MFISANSCKKYHTNSEVDQSILPFKKNRVNPIATPEKIAALHFKHCLLGRSSLDNLLVKFLFNSFSRQILFDGETSNNRSFQEFEYLK